MTVWVTKYALSRGVLKVMVDDHGDGDDCVRYKAGVYFHGEGTEWHRTEASAMTRVGVLIAAARKVIAHKLQRLDQHTHEIEAGTFLVEDLTKNTQEDDDG